MSTKTRTKATFRNDNDRLPMWTVYDHPRDCPGHYVARKFLTLPHVEATGEAIADVDVDRIREFFARYGLTRLHRQTGDDPAIMETWL